LKWGSIASGSTAALGELAGSVASGGAEAAVWAGSDAACDCAQAAGTAAPSSTASANAMTAARLRPGRLITKAFIMKMNFNFNIMTTS
jgi:hypothetical protein